MYLSSSKPTITKPGQLNKKNLKTQEQKALSDSPPSGQKLDNPRQNSKELELNQNIDDQIDQIQSGKKLSSPRTLRNKIGILQKKADEGDADAICSLACLSKLNNDIISENEEENNGDLDLENKYFFDNNMLIEIKESIKLDEEKESLIKENQALRKENESIKKENKSLKNENDSLKKENKTVKKENQSLINENESLKKEIEKMKKQLKITEDFDHVPIELKEEKKEKTPEKSPEKGKRKIKRPKIKISVSYPEKKEEKPKPPEKSPEKDKEKMKKQKIETESSSIFDHLSSEDKESKMLEPLEHIKKKESESEDKESKMLEPLEHIKKEESESENKGSKMLEPLEHMKKEESESEEEEIPKPPEHIKKEEKDKKRMIKMPKPPKHMKKEESESVDEKILKPPEHLEKEKIKRAAKSDYSSEDEEESKLNINVIKAIVTNYEQQIRTKNQNKTILHLGCESKNLQVVKYILSQDIVDINRSFTENDVSRTALHIAVENNDIKIVKLLLKQPKLNVNAISIKNSNTKIHKEKNTRTNNHHPRIVNNKQHFSSEKSALHIAVENKFIEIIKLLLKHPNINVNIISKQTSGSDIE